MIRLGKMRALGGGVVHADGAEPRGPVAGRAQKIDGFIKQQGRLAQRLRGGIAPRQFWRHHRGQPFVCQRQRIDAGIFAIAKADRHIHVAPGHVEHAQGGRQAQVDLGMGVGKFIQPGGQPFRREGRPRRHGQRGFAADLSRRAPRRGEQAKPLGRARSQRPPCICQLNRAGEAVKQGLAQVVFQRFDLKRQRRRGHVQFVGRAGEGHMPRRCIEGAQGCQRGQGVCHDG